MLLSTLIEESSLNHICTILNEQTFEKVGLIGNGVFSAYLTFLENEKYINDLDGNITMVMVTPEIAKKLSNTNIGLCITEYPRLAYFELHNWLAINKKDYKIKECLTKIGSNCKISKLSVISDNNVIIGNNVVIEEFVVIRENTEIGDNSIIRSGSKIGCEGFEFKSTKDGTIPIIHCGSVKIGNNVEIQYNTCVDKAVYPHDTTIIGNYSKIDNLVHIGHGVKIGENVMIVALSGIGGRTIIENNVWIGFGAIIRNGLEIKNNARVNMGAIVTKTVNENQAVSGNFAIDHKIFIERMKTIK